MREIQLSPNGKKYKGMYVAIVDDEDFELVNQFIWSCTNNKKANTVYAFRTVITKSKRYDQKIQHLILGEKYIDHIDGNGLNNQKNNLRKCTVQQNGMNRTPNTNATSKYKGVVWNKSSKKWQSQIGFSNKTIYIGLYTDEIEAAKAYDSKAKELFKEFARLNFPE